MFDSACPLCGATVAAHRADQHAEWHKHLDRAINAKDTKSDKT